MTKVAFLDELRVKLIGLSKDDVDSRIDFYSEMIDDRIEEGKDEEEAVNEIGSVDDVIRQIASETSLLKLIKEKVKPKRDITLWEIVLIVLGFPIWFSLLFSLVIICIVAYILIWTLVIITYSLEIGFVYWSGYSLYCYFASSFNYIYLGSALLGAGLSIYMIFACIGATKITLKLTKIIALSLKKRIVTRGK